MADKAFVYHRLRLTLLFTAVFRVDSCGLVPKETSSELWPKEDSTFHIPCDVNVVQCGNKKNTEFTWHVLRKSSSELLNTGSSPKYAVLEKGALTVRSFNANDSGVYFCGVSLGDQGKKGQQMIGHGTRVTIAVLSHQIQQAFLWLFFAILALYSLIVLILLIMKMMGRDISIGGKSGNGSSSGNSSTRRRHFRAVVQELYSKRNPRNSATSPAHRPALDCQFENPHTTAQDDDIYQNM
ncbi:uncharacterized protein LOC134463752 [Engraulis encrasicolus]|uniref:uncharacterized protein LOC134463752 n=1 Tax=Engraulis encrasicolus TaxID=184585 RepID=UPI002FCF091B